MVISRTSIFETPIYKIIFLFLGEPGLNNQKSPTILLLDPNQNFHSFGCAARDYYHDLEPSEAHLWYYFDKFKMTLHNNTVST